MMSRTALCCCLLSVFTAPSLCAGETRALPDVTRRDFYVSSERDVRIFVREVQPRTGNESAGMPVVLIHGARPSGAAWFDLQVPGGSLAAAIAVAGHAVYVPDIRGFGRSTLPQAMNEPAEKSAPLVRSSEAVRDIRAVVESIVRERHVERVAILGWATGGHWAGYYATLHPEHVGRLILCNTLYGASSAWPLQRGIADSNDPARLAQSERVGYRLASAASLLSRWDRSIPTADKSVWRDPAVASAYTAAALAADSTSGSRNPPSIRVPNGAIEDSYYLSQGRQFWDASLIYSPTLIVRSELDFWSRPEDVTRLRQHLVHAPSVRVVEIPEATHYVLMDRAEKGRRRLLDEVLAFLASGSARNPS